MNVQFIENLNELIKSTWDQLILKLSSIQGIGLCEALHYYAISNKNGKLRHSTLIVSVCWTECTNILLIRLCRPTLLKWIPIKHSLVMNRLVYQALKMKSLSLNININNFEMLSSIIQPLFTLPTYKIFPPLKITENCTQLKRIIGKDFRVEWNKCITSLCFRIE